MAKNKLKSFAAIAAFILSIYLIIHYWPNISSAAGKVFSAAAPVFIGAIMAYVLNILMSFYERHFFPKSSKKAVLKLRRPVSVIGALITLVGIIALVAVLVTPQLVACVQMVIAELPAAIEWVLAKLQALPFLPDDILDYLASVEWSSKIGAIASKLSGSLGSAVDVAYSAVSSVVGGVIDTVIGLIFALYLLFDKDRLLRQIKRLMNAFVPQKSIEKINYVSATVNDCFHDFIVGQCTEALILGVLCMLGMTVLRLPYAPMIGALMAFTALIPIVGGFIGAGVGVFLILMESPIKALVFLIFVNVLQQIEGNLIYPKVVGKSIGLPGLWVLAAVTVGGGVWGIAGMLIGVPLAAAVYRLIKEYLAKKEQAEVSQSQPEDDNGDSTKLSVNGGN